MARVADQSSASSRTDTELVAACLTGSDEAWRSLIARYKRLVFSIPVKWHIPREDAIDIFQAVWVDCFQNLSSLKNIERLQPWLIRIAVRKCYHYVHDLRRSAETQDADPDAQADDAAGSHALIEQVQREQAVRDAVQTLSPRCRQILSALFYEDPRPSYQAAAARFGLSVNSIGFTRERCLTCLRKALADMGYPE